ncbi:uncharacterized protein LOC144703234 [Wolffia australiana]
MADAISFLFLLAFSSQSVLSQVQVFPTAAPPLDGGDFAALAEIRSNLRDLPGSDFFSSWNLDSPSAISDACSSFAGVSCDSETLTLTLTLRVTSLHLGGSLAGTLAPAIADLGFLSELVLSPGQVTGSIPPSLASLSSLRLLSLSNNLLTGQIPSLPLPSLHTLDLSHNLLSGEIPGGLFDLPSLRVAILAVNSISGSLPVISSPLLHLDLRENAISGEMPAFPASLRYLSLAGNGLRGGLGGLAGGFPELAYLDLSSNRLTGPVPAALFVARRAPEPAVPPPPAVVLLQRNNLTGGVPAAADPAALAGWTVDLSHNRLGGPVPAGMARVGSLFLNHNRLRGAVPGEVVRSLYEGAMETLYAQHNFLSAVEGAVAPPLPAGVTVCLAFNCMDQAPGGPSGCPDGAAGPRPPSQCPPAADWGSDRAEP